MTGAAARIAGRVGAAYSAWDGYIAGKTLELAPGKRIVQSWRTTEFASDDPGFDNNRRACADQDRRAADADP